VFREQIYDELTTFFIPRCTFVEDQGTYVSETQQSGFESIPPTFSSSMSPTAQASEMPRDPGESCPLSSLTRVYRRVFTPPRVP